MTSNALVPEPAEGRWLRIPNRLTARDVDPAIGNRRARRAHAAKVRRGDATEHERAILDGVLRRANTEEAPR